MSVKLIIRAPKSQRFVSIIHYSNNFRKAILKTSQHSDDNYCDH